MSKFKDVILEALTNNIDIDRLLQIVKPELIKQCQGLTIEDDGNIKIRLEDSAYIITLRPISIVTQEEEEFEEGEENINGEEQQDQAIDPNILASLDNLSKSSNPTLAASAKKTMTSLNNNINALGTALVNKTQKMLQDAQK
jgi:uncharacterized protein (UPF0371 family)|nr:MAG TPA: hypothetical protein [Caudoviricetes sp.]